VKLVVGVNVIVEVKVGELLANTDVSKFAIETASDTRTELDTVIREDVEERDIEGLIALCEAVEVSGGTVETVEEDEVEAGTVPTKALEDEAGVVAPELEPILVAKDVELFVDESSESGVEDRTRDDAAVAIVSIVVETLSVEADAAVVLVSTTDCVEVEVPEFVLVATVDGGIGMTDVSAALSMAFVMNLSISRPGLIANTMPFWQ
jgi:hypothetical protein